MADNIFTPEIDEKRKYQQYTPRITIDCAKDEPLWTVTFLQQMIPWVDGAVKMGGAVQTKSFALSLTPELLAEVDQFTDPVTQQLVRISAAGLLEGVTRKYVAKVPREPSPEA